MSTVRTLAGSLVGALVLGFASSAPLVAQSLVLRKGTRAAPLDTIPFAGAPFYGPASGFQYSASPPRELVFSVPLVPRFGAPGGNSEQDDEFCCDKTYFWPTIGEIGLILLAPWYFNRNVSDDSTAVLSWDSWKRNIIQGMEWDSDNFKTNMFGHPYGGAMYFNAAKSNGYNFWQSSFFVWTGSFLWENFGEANRPAINDWAATSLGGIGIGETFYRTSRMIWDNSATGFGRALRELGGLVLNPTGGLSRLIRGEWTKVGKNPDDRIPVASNGWMHLGARHTGETGAEEARTGAYFAFNWVYGDPFHEVDDQKPYDFFTLGFQVNGNDDKTRLGRLQTEGTLYAQNLHQTEKSHHIFRFTQHFDYLNNLEVETGGSSLGAAFMSRLKLSDEFDLVGQAEPSALLIWGVDSEYAQFTGRDYDFGAGAGLRLGAGLRYNDNDVVDAFYLLFWQHTLNGAIGNQFISFLGVRLMWPLMGDFGLGGQYFLTTQDSYYRDFPDVFRRFPEYRLFVTYYFRGPRTAP